MHQQTEENVSDATVRIPENALMQYSAPDPTREKNTESEKKQKTGDSTIIKSVRDYIFSKENGQESEELSFQADPSVEFRNKLEQSGRKYKIEKVVATGGFGRIFQVEDRVLGRKAIVKTLKEEFLQDEKAIKHFISEAKLNSQLDHPGIVPLFSLDSDNNGGLHLAMQRITGITLKEYLIRSRKLQLEKHFSQKIYNLMLKERLEIFLNICNTISYCHDRGVLHNDLKPDNIMIGKHGQVYVMDWGLASMDGAPKPNYNAGAPAYMAPERICSCILSKQTDIFALGMILNELVTLRTSIQGTSISNILERICTGQLEPSSCIDPKRNIPSVLKAIIEKGRNANPQKRYSSVKTFADDVRHFLQHEETIAHPDSVFQKMLRFLFHHYGFAASLTVGVILLFVSAIAYNYYNASMITRKADRETVRKLHLTNSTNQKGALLGERLLLFQEQTVNMASALAVELGKKVYDSKAPLFWNEDFAPRSKKRPPGLIHTAACKGKAITLSTGTFYRLRNSISPKEIQDWADNFRAQQSQYFANVLTNVRKKETSFRSDKLKLFYEHGSSVQRIICVLENGLVYCYPGKYEKKSSRDDFIPEYISRELRSGKNFAWSSPYLDPESGFIVVSCWHTIHSLRGNKIGTIGSVIIYEDLLKDFLKDIEKSREQAFYTLVDSEARTIYSSEKAFNLSALYSSPSTNDSSRNPFYEWYSEVIRHIRENPSQNQFTTALNKKNFYITWKRLPSSEWLLIQHVPLND